MNHWEALVDAVRLKAEVCCWVSLATSILLMVLYYFLVSVRRTPGWLVCRATLCDMVVSVSLLLLLYSHDLGRDEEFRISDNTLVHIICYFEVVGSSLRSAIYFYLVSIYRNPFQPERHRVFILPVVLLLGLLLMFVVREAVPGEQTTDTILGVGLCWMPCLVFMMIGGGAFLFVQLLVRWNRKLVQKHVPHCSNLITSLARQRVARHGIAYFVLFGLELTIPVVLTLVWRWTDTWRMDGVWWQVITFSITLRPAISFLGWMVINDVVYKLCGCCSNKRRSRPQIELAAEIAGVSFERLSAMTTQEKEVLIMNTQGIQEQGFKEDLRFELIFDVIRGLGELAERELFGPSHRPPLRNSNGLPIDVEMVGTGEYSATSSVRLRATSEDSAGIAVSSRMSQSNSDVSNTSSNKQPISFVTCASSGGPQSPALRGTLAQKAGAHSPLLVKKTHTDASGKTDKSGKTSRSGAQGSPLTPLSPIRFGEPGEPGNLTASSVSRARHYKTDSFSAIRKRCGISNNMYAATFPNNLSSELTMEWRKKLKESVSEGASGAFFYRVSSAKGVGAKLLVKQVSSKEKNVLLRILPAYHDHVMARQGKTLIQYYGVHSMPLNWNFSRRVYFVVMRNFLPEKMWLTFDLKGATANRRALTENVLYKTEGLASSGTLRDWEWLDIAMSADVSNEDRIALSDMIASDCLFLAEQNLLDYSLLMGIHRLPAGLSSEEQQEYISKMEAHGAYVSLDRQKVYFFGIIDALETYNLRWKIQHCVLKVAYHLVFQPAASDGISAMPPREYAERFEAFIRREVLARDTLRIGALSPVERELSVRAADFGRRWHQLWDTNKKGLVRVRIEAERVDNYANAEWMLDQIREIEDELADLDEEIRGAREEAAQGTRVTFAREDVMVETTSYTLPDDLADDDVPRSPRQGRSSALSSKEGGEMQETVSWAVASPSSSPAHSPPLSPPQSPKSPRQTRVWFSPDPTPLPATTSPGQPATMEKPRLAAKAGAPTSSSPSPRTPRRSSDASGGISPRPRMMPRFAGTPPTSKGDGAEAPRGIWKWASALFPTERRSSLFAGTPLESPARVVTSSTGAAATSPANLFASALRTAATAEEQEEALLSTAEVGAMPLFGTAASPNGASTSTPLPEVRPVPPLSSTVPLASSSRSEANETRAVVDEEKQQQQGLPGGGS